MQPIATLLDRTRNLDGPSLSAPLRAAYGGDLQFPVAAARPVYVFANFVTTLDGIVSYEIPGNSRGEDISDFDDADHFIMGVLRSSADAVLVGSGTLRGDPGRVRIPETICPAFRGAFREFRETVLKKPTRPLVVVVTGSGTIDFDEPSFHTPGVTAVIITTASGYERLHREHGRSLAAAEIRKTGDPDDKVSPAEILRILHDEFGVARLLHEGGPTIFGRFLAEDLVDELFLTLSPQIAGRDAAHPRLSLVEQCLYTPDGAPWFDLLSLKVAQSHLFFRYRRRGTDDRLHPARA